MRFRVNSILILIPNLGTEKHEDVDIEVSTTGLYVFCKPLPKLYPPCVPYVAVGPEVIQVEEEHPQANRASLVSSDLVICICERCSRLIRSGQLFNSATNEEGKIIYFHTASLDCEYTCVHDLPLTAACEPCQRMNRKTNAREMARKET